MAIPGTFQTYDLAVGVKLDVENVIWTIDPFEVPLQGGYGADNLTALSHDTVFEKKVEWLDENLLLPKSTLGAAVATTTTTIIQLAAGGGIHFQTGDIIQFDGEQLQITSYGTTADYLNVSRGFNATTAFAGASGDIVIGLGAAMAEGADPGAARAVDRTDRVNYTQIFGPTLVQVSGTEQVVQKYGVVGTEFDHQLANRVKENGVGVEYALLNGIASAGSATVGRTMGGFASYITTNVDSSTTTLTDALLLAQLQACFDTGGKPDRMVVGSKQKRVISGLGSANIRYQQTTNTRGQVVDYYVSDFGTLSVVLDRWCLVNQAFLFAREQATISTLRPQQFEMLAKTGDSIKGQIIAEKTLKFRLQTHAAKFTALT